MLLELLILWTWTYSKAQSSTSPRSSTSLRPRATVLGEYTTDYYIYTPAQPYNESESQGKS